MADRLALGRLGLTLGAITATVMLLATVVVKGHLDGTLAPDGATMTAASVSPATPRR